MSLRSKYPMVMFILKRLAFLVATYLIALTIIFTLPRLIPGNPFIQLFQRVIAAYMSKPELVGPVYRSLVEMYGLNKPLWEQYILFLVNAFRGDFGISISMYPLKVIDIIAMVLPYTLALLVPAVIASWTIGNIIGAYVGYKRGTVVEKVSVGYSFIVSNIPYYWLAMLLLYAFAYHLRIFPPFGAYSPGMTPSLSLSFIADYLWHYVLPFLSIFIVSMAGWMGGMRIIIMGELGSDYIQFSENMGVRDRIVFRYAFRNSLLPQVTGLAISLGFTIAGQVILENVFVYPGIGRVLSQAIGTLDYPLIQGTFTMLIAAVYISTFIVDFIYALIDPRIRVGG